MLPDFNRLKVFYFVYTEKSSTAAARHLNITQSGVSQHLQKLESELNLALFTRAHRQLVPTAAGQRLFHILKPFMEELEVKIRNIKKAQTIPAGHLRIGCPVEFGKTHMPGIFASFREQFPDVTFFLKLGDPETLLPMVSKGELDFAYIDIFPNAGQIFGDFNPYTIEPIADEELVLACSKIYYDKKIKGNHSIKQLSKKEYISYKPHASALLSWYKFSFGISSIQLNVVLTIDCVEAVIGAIARHLGLGIIATHFIADEINRGEIIPIRISSKKIINKIAFFQLLNKNPTLSEKYFQIHLRNEIKKSGLNRTDTR
jgi:DNA-binding transcriptional LysR family regulator